MEKALGENTAKYIHSGPMLLALQERGASGGQSDFNISNQCRGRGRAEGMEVDTWSCLPLGLVIISFQRTPLSTLHFSLV